MSCNQTNGQNNCRTIGVFPGTERQCAEDEHDDEYENDPQTSEFELIGLYAMKNHDSAKLRVGRVTSDLDWRVVLCSDGTSAYLGLLNSCNFCNS